MLQPVIIAGGSGTRLWPLSRQLYPKQFLPLVDDKTMFQATLARLQDLHCAPPIIVCNKITVLSPQNSRAWLALSTTALF